MIAPLALVALALAAGAVRAQTPVPEVLAVGVPPPASLAGSWVGSFNVNFALANASDPYSWECLPASAPAISVPHFMSFSKDGTVTDGTYPTVTVKVGAATYTWPGSDWLDSYLFLGLDSKGILSLAFAGDYVGYESCHLATVVAGRLTYVTIGGSDFGFTDQCSAASYSMADNKNVPTTPFCRRESDESAVALGSSVVGTYSLAAASRTPAPTPTSSATSSDFGFTPQPPPKLLSSATSFSSPNPQLGGVNNGGGAVPSGASNGGGGSSSNTDYGGGSGSGSGSGAANDNSGGSASGRGVDDAGGATATPPGSLYTKGPSSSGAQGVASLASVAIAAFLGAAVAAALQRRA
jgi:hypothetical protein